MASNPLEQAIRDLIAAVKRGAGAAGSAAGSAAGGAANLLINSFSSLGDIPGRFGLSLAQGTAAAAKYLGSELPQIIVGSFASVLPAAVTKAVGSLASSLALNMGHLAAGVKGFASLLFQNLPTLGSVFQNLGHVLAGVRGWAGIAAGAAGGLVGRAASGLAGALAEVRLSEWADGVGIAVGAVVAFTRAIVNSVAHLRGFVENMQRSNNHLIMFNGNLFASAVELAMGDLRRSFAAATYLEESIVGLNAATNRMRDSWFAFDTELQDATNRLGEFAGNFMAGMGGPIGELAGQVNEWLKGFGMGGKDFGVVMGAVIAETFRGAITGIIDVVNRFVDIVNVINKILNIIGTDILPFFMNVAAPGAGNLMVAAGVLPKLGQMNKVPQLPPRNPGGGAQAALNAQPDPAIGINQFINGMNNAFGARFGALRPQALPGMPAMPGP